MFASMGMLAQAVGGGVTDTAITVESGATFSSTTNTFSITGATIGAAGANRWVAVVWGGALGSAAAVSAFTLGGVAPDYSNNQFNGDGHAGIGIWQYPTGTTADVSLMFTTSSERGVLQVFSFQSSAADPRHATYGINTTVGSTTINVAEGGAIFAAIGLRGGNSSNTWTGATKAQEYDVNTNEWTSTAGIGSLSVETGRTVSYSSAISNGAGFVVWSLKPN